jgi:hypothetical protein
LLPALCGYASDLLARTGIFEEGQPFVVKPVSPAILLEKIRRVLDGQA